MTMKMNWMNNDCLEDIMKDWKLATKAPLNFLHGRPVSKFNITNTCYSLPARK